MNLQPICSELLKGRGTQTVRVIQQGWRQTVQLDRLQDLRGQPQHGSV